MGNVCTNLYRDDNPLSYLEELEQIKQSHSSRGSLQALTLWLYQWRVWYTVEHVEFSCQKTRSMPEDKKHCRWSSWLAWIHRWTSSCCGMWMSVMEKALGALSSWATRKFITINSVSVRVHTSAPPVVSTFMLIILKQNNLWNSHRMLMLQRIILLAQDLTNSRLIINKFL